MFKYDNNISINLIKFIKKYILDISLKKNSVIQKNFNNYRNKEDNNNILTNINLFKFLNIDKLNFQILKDFGRFSFLEININNINYTLNNINLNNSYNKINKQLVDLTNNNLEIISLLKLFLTQFILNPLYEFIDNKFKFKSLIIDSNGSNNSIDINCNAVINEDKKSNINLNIKNNIITYNLNLYFYIRVQVVSENNSKKIYNIASININFQFEIKDLNYKKSIIHIKSDTDWFYYEKPIIIDFLSNFNNINSIVNKNVILNILLNNLSNANQDMNIKDMNISLINFILNIKNERDIIIYKLIYEYLISKNKNNLSLILNYKVSNNINNDYLLICYNEKNNKYENKDSLALIYKIYKENPSFVILCTQETSPGKNSYQYIFEENIKKLNYKLLIKEDASSGILIKNKNVRSIIYYNTDKVVESTFDSNISNKYIILDFEKKISKKSGLGKIFEKTFNKGSIFMRLEVKNQNLEQKIIIINSHLFFDKSSKNTGLKKREEEFIKIVEEFNLIEYWKKGYNIFFCGDLNFRLYNTNNMSNIENYNKAIYNIVKTYVENNRERSTNILKKRNQLYQFLSKLDNQIFYNGLKNSIDKLGINLTSKYYKKMALEEYKFYLDKKLNEYKNIFKIEGKNRKYPRIPSSSDKILFILNQKEDINFNYNFMLLPDKSSHKMITISFDILNIKNI